MDVEFGVDPGISVLHKVSGETRRFRIYGRMSSKGYLAQVLPESGTQPVNLPTGPDSHGRGTDGPPQGWEPTPEAALAQAEAAVSSMLGVTVDRLRSEFEMDPPLKTWLGAAEFVPEPAP